MYLTEAWIKSNGGTIFRGEKYKDVNWMEIDTSKATIEDVVCNTRICNIFADDWEVLKTKATKVTMVLTAENKPEVKVDFENQTITIEFEEK
jgi:hypothetical protein